MGDNLREQDGANYVRPPHQQSPFRQRFDLFVEDDKQPNRAIPTGLGVKFGEVSFRGEYPIGKVKYRGADHEVEMDLEAFSPFIPLDIDRSAYPATTLTYTVKNTGTKKESYRLVYAFENPVLAYSKRSRNDFNLDAKVHENGVIALATKKTSASPDRPDVLVEDWSSGTYGNWVATGTAFGDKPRRVSDLPSYMGSVDAGTEFGDGLSIDGDSPGQDEFLARPSRSDAGGSQHLLQSLEAVVGWTDRAPVAGAGLGWRSGAGLAARRDARGPVGGTGSGH
jgi:hypothetical protein